jgi:hypothetical protein
MSASALASRRINVQSSYTTTTDHSSTDPTPPCEEAVYKRSLDDEKVKTVDLISEMEQTSDVNIFGPHRDEELMVEGNGKNTGKGEIDRACWKRERVPMRTS